MNYAAMYSNLGAALMIIVAGLIMAYITSSGAAVRVTLVVILIVALIALLFCVAMAGLLS